MALRSVQWSPKYCEEAQKEFEEKGRKAMYGWDTSHDLSVIDSTGQRHRIGTFRSAGLAQEIGELIEKHGLAGLT